jgi:predicted GTPase
MGMYDTVYCKYQLPQPEEPKGYTGSLSFQTKDLECALSEYNIDENGSLILIDKKYEVVPQSETKPISKKKVSWFDNFPKMKCVETNYIEQKITTTIFIYDYQQTDGEYDYSIEYKIVIIDGKVSAVELSEFKAIYNKNRKKQDEEFFEEINRRNKFVKTKKYKFIIRPYNYVIDSVCSLIIKMLHKLHECIYYIQRNFTL